MKFDRRELVTAIAVIGLGLMVIGTQLRSLTTEVFNWDEHTFMLMAQDVLRGHLPYVEHFDNKPPGIFLLLAAAMKLFGESLWVTRAVGAASVLLTAGMLFGLLQSRIGSWAAFLAGAMVVVALATGYGSYASVELISIVFIMAALWLMADWGERRWTSVLVGLMLCCATLVRSNLGLVAVGVGMLYLGAIWTGPAMGLRRNGLIGYVAGGLVPVAVLASIYAAAGKLDIFYLSTVTVPISYALGQQSAWQVFRGLLERFLRPNEAGLEGLRIFWGITLVCGLSGLVAFVRGGREDMRRLFLFGTVVLVATGVSIVVGGVVGSLRFITQLLPAAAVLIGVGIGTLPRWLRRATLTLCALTALAVTAISTPKSIEVIADAQAVTAAYPMRQAAEAIAADREPGDRVWALRSHLVLFYLDEPPLSWVATHPDSLDREVIADPVIAAGLAAPDEFARILATRPRYVVTDANPAPAYLTTEHEAQFAAVMAAEYEPFGTSGKREGGYGPVRVLKRR